jgi:hypothetical protein
VPEHDQVDVAMDPAASVSGPASINAQKRLFHPAQIPHAVPGGSRRCRQFPQDDQDSPALGAKFLASSGQPGTLRDLNEVVGTC